MADINRRLLLDGVKTFRLSEGAIPQPPPDGFVVKIEYAGICHSDVHVSQSLMHPNYQFPRVLGHEIGGTIHSIGSNLGSAWSTGERVVVFPWNGCQDCVYCQTGFGHCSNNQLPTGKGPVGCYDYGVWRDGGYQQYVEVHKADFILRVPDELPMKVATVVPCSGITALNAVTSLEEGIQKALKHTGKATVAVIGAGGLGLWAVQILKAFYPENVTVVAVDIHDDKLTDAKLWGADIIHKWDAKAASREAAAGLYKECNNSYLDAAIDFIGIESVIERAFMSLNVGGTLCMIGIAGPKTPSFLVRAVVIKGITIRGRYVGSKDHCVKLMTLLTEGKVKPPPLTEVGLEDVEKTILLLQQGKQRGRAVVRL